MRKLSDKDIHRLFKVPVNSMINFRNTLLTKTAEVKPYDGTVECLDCFFMDVCEGWEHSIFEKHEGAVIPCSYPGPDYIYKGVHFKEISEVLSK